jgi:hypothetical protein
MFRVLAGNDLMARSGAMSVLMLTALPAALLS